jgi:NAD(P)-dependent dehydrogenase (short-subunit alcohol dehydrogenase family)
MNERKPRKALIIGASRTLGLAIATELARREWDVVATVRSGHSQALQDAAVEVGRPIRVEKLDFTDEGQLTALLSCLDGIVFDLLFISAGITNADEPAAQVPTDEFANVMITNALSPMRTVEALRGLVAPHGTIGVMSSRQGSVSFNTRGGHEVYRASKAALNQLMRSYAARRHDDPRTLLLLHPGWVQTELGGPGAQLTVAQSADGVVTTIETHLGDGGLQFLDYQNQTVPW